MRQTLTICCFCEKIRDDQRTEAEGEVWQEFKIYMATYRLWPSDVEFYCPTCLMSYHAFLRSQAAVPRQQME
jgi:hypothetical protein